MGSDYDIDVDDEYDGYKIRVQRKKMLEGIVEVVSPSGKGFRIVGQNKGDWFNKGKMLAEDAIAGLKKGDFIQFNAPDGKWVMSLKKGEKHDGAIPAPQVSPAMAKVFAPQHDGTTEKSNSIARGCAANAVLGSPYVSELLKGGCEEETVANVKSFMEKVAEFVYGGKW